jgi:hypothetical protein
MGDGFVADGVVAAFDRVCDNLDPRVALAGVASSACAFRENRKRKHGW